MSLEHLRTGDRAIVRFRFIKSPEYLRLGMKLVFREGRTKAIGSISQVIPHVTTQASTTRGKTRGQQTADSSQAGKRNETGDEATRSSNKRSRQGNVAPLTPATTTTAETTVETNVQEVTATTITNTNSS